MRKIKIFSDMNDMGRVEEMVNQWLTKKPAIIIFKILQSESFITGRHSLTITIFYYEGEQGYD